MPKQPSLPAVHLAGVERARYVAAVQEAADRNGREIAAGKAPDAAPPVRGVDAVTGVTVQGETRGAHAHELKKKRTRKKKDVAPPKGPTPPDPNGLGTSIDLKA